MRFLHCAVTASLAAVGSASPSPHYPGPSSDPQGHLKRFQSLVVFGDSYTDDSRLGYFVQHNGTAPPVGWVNPVNQDASSGGRIWAQYVRQYSGANLYNYAVSGAVCSNDITPRIVKDAGFLFPAIEQYEVPAFVADSKYVNPDGKKALDIPVDSTVYAIWIGTNDLGGDALISDSQVKGTNITTYVDCVYNQLHRLYENGARNFVLMNIAPLNLAPLYALPGAGGIVGPSAFWPDKPANTTEISSRMMEQVVTVNAIFDYRTAFTAEISHDWVGSSWAVYDVHGLISDIYHNPSRYLNGTAPLDVTGIVQQCNATGGACVKDLSPDSFLWFDALHPSEQTDRIIARNFVDVVQGRSKWATYWRS